MLSKRHGKLCRLFHFWETEIRHFFGWNYSWYCICDIGKRLSEAGEKKERNNELPK